MGGRSGVAAGGAGSGQPGAGGVNASGGVGLGGMAERGRKIRALAAFVWVRKGRGLFVQFFPGGWLNEHGIIWMIQ